MPSTLHSSYASIIWACLHYGHSVCRANECCHDTHAKFSKTQSYLLKTLYAVVYVRDIAVYLLGFLAGFYTATMEIVGTLESGNMQVVPDCYL